LAKRNQNPEFRKAQREQAVKAAKDAARALKAKKEKEKAKVVSHFCLLFCDILEPNSLRLLVLGVD
jgi:hypothetical protein